MVDFGGKVQGGGLEGVFGRKGEVKVEDAALLVERINRLVSCFTGLGILWHRDGRVAGKVGFRVGFRGGKRTK